jgi:hypothetical protein
VFSPLSVENQIRPTSESAWGVGISFVNIVNSVLIGERLVLSGVQIAVKAIFSSAAKLLLRFIFPSGLIVIFPSPVPSSKLNVPSSVRAV